MKNNILTIAKKEFARFFGDSRMVITSLILPGVMIYLLYSFMGTALKDLLNVSDNYRPRVYGVMLTGRVRQIMTESGFDIIDITEQDVMAAKNEVTNKEADLLVIIPENFDDLVAQYDVSTQSLAPNVEIYFNAANTKSQESFSRLESMLNAYESSMSNKFDINRDDSPDSNYNIATKEDTSAFVMSSMMPLLLMIFMFSGCMGIAPESIAGEKERGTIATLLVTPMRRRELTIGKILSLGFLSFLCGLSSLIGTFMSFPKMTGGENLSVNIYAIGDYVCLAVVILSTILLIISLISVISAFAKSVKEAGMYVTPLMIIAMLVGVTSMFSSGATQSAPLYLIPLYSSVQCFSGILALDYSAAHIVITAVSSLVYACAAGFVLTKMLSSEKIVFSR